MTIYYPYTYLIGWSHLDRWYYGVRLSNTFIPEEDLWVKYYTSSKRVASFIEENGPPDIIKVDRTFTTWKEASEYEVYFLTENNCIYSEKWLNLACFPAIIHDDISIHKIKKARYNQVITEDHKRAISKGCSGTKNGMYGKSHSPESIEKMKRNRKGKGKQSKSPETRALMSKAHKGRPQKKIQCPHCGKWGGNTMGRWHFDNCQSIS